MSVRRKAALSVLAAYWLVMFVGTHLPPTDDGPSLVNDKVLHFCGFAGLGFLLVAAGVRPWLKAAAVAAAYGIFDELSQPAFDRTADILDWVADVAGASCGALIAWRIGVRRPADDE